MCKFCEHFNLIIFVQKKIMITVIVPIYNVEAYLPTCIESIINQTYRNLEVLLVDDGSTDNSGKICDDYVRRDNRCIVIHQENKGLSGARNTGLDNAKGEYIAFVDGDDYIHPQMFELLYDVLQKGDYGFSMTLYEKVWITNRCMKPIMKFEAIVIFQKQLMNFLFNKIPHSTGFKETEFQVVWNKLYRSDIIAKERFSQTASEDLEFNTRIYMKCNNAIMIFARTYFWFQRSSSITHQPISLNFIDRINSCYLCLQKISEINEEYKSLCIEKLYKTILNVRYRTNVTIYKDNANELIQKIISATIDDFWKDSHINFFMKLILFLFYKIPVLYRILISCSELVCRFYNR